MSGEPERKTISVAQLSSKPMEGQRLRAKPTQEQMANHYNSTTSVDNTPSDAVGEKIQMNNMPVDNKEGSEQMHDNNSTVPVQNETSPNRANSETPEAGSALSLSHSSIEEETSTVTSCPFNWSKSWLQNPRYGNIPETNSHTLPIEGPLLSHSNLQALLDQQRICEGDCPFRKVSDVSNLKAEDISEEEIYIWTVRLIYVSIYYHQHRHAIQEGAERKISLSKDNVDLSSTCSTEMEEFKVGTFDYECKDAKYLVTQTLHGGIGAMYLFRMLNMMMSALATDRTLVVYGNLQNNGTTLAGPWLLSSCDRQDLQCEFQPLTGCAMSVEDIQTAKPTPHKEFRNFLRDGDLTKSDPFPEKVLHFQVGNTQINDMNRVLHKMHSIASSLIDELNPNDPRIPVLRKATEGILEQKPTTGKEFIYSDSAFVQAYLMYVLRPTKEKGEELDTSALKDIPPNFDETVALGLPIRGSDKCFRESECLQFPTYMHLMDEIWKESVMWSANGTAHILITSEIPDIMEKAHAFSTNETYLSKISFKPDWITNTNDVRQGTGSVFGESVLRNRNKGGGIILSALSALKIQMRAAHSVANCCSNFHQIIINMLRGGCGMQPTNRGQCLHKRKEPIFHLHCWPKSKRKEKSNRLAKLSAQFNRSSISVQDAEQFLWELK